MNGALAAVVSQSQSRKVSTSSKARQYKSSAPRTWLEWTPSQKSLCVQLFLEGNYNHDLDLPQGLPSYMHKDHAEKKCQTGDTFKRLMIKVDTEVAKDRRDHGVAQNYPCVVIMDWVGSHLDDDELKRVDDAEIRLAN